MPINSPPVLSRLLSGVLTAALLLSLTGCGAAWREFAAPEGFDFPEGGGVPYSGGLADGTAVPGDRGFFALPGIDENAALVRVDGREVPGWACLYWLALSCDRLTTETRDAGKSPDWSAPVDDGTLSDYAKGLALSNAALYAEVEALAEEYGCALDDADRAAMASRWEKRCAGHGGETAYLRTLARFGLDRARAEQLFRVGRLYGKLCARCRAGEGPSPTAAALDALAAADGVRVDRILVAAGDDRNAARNRAAVLFSRLNGAAEQETLFRELAAAQDDPAGPRTLREGVLDARLTEIGNSLAVGQMSGIVETGEGFSILMRLSDDREELADRWFDALLQDRAARADVDVSAAFRELDAADFAAALSSLRARLDGNA